jgi:very-short-patch-repair endonuclease
MGATTVHARAWALVRRQHGVITREQLLALGFSAKAIRHRVSAGRLHPVMRGVYAVGRPELTQKGRWIAAVLACGPGAVLSHESAAALWGIRKPRSGPIHVSVPASRRARHKGIVVHRRTKIAATVKDNIPLTSPTATLIDLAAQLTGRQLEAAVNEADALDLATPAEVRAAAEQARNAKLKRLLDRHTFRLTDSELERWFLRIVRKTGLPMPQTQRHVDDFRTDFYFADLDLVVEADSLRYHRTPSQQAKDRLRDQEHAAAGRSHIRFTHTQIRYDAKHVETILLRVAELARQVRQVHPDDQRHRQPDVHGRHQQPGPGRHRVVAASLR